MEHVTMVDGTARFEIGGVATRVAADLGEEEAAARLDELQGELRALQELMFASGANGVLVILQGMDAAGKDVTIQHVFATATAEAIRVEHLSSTGEEEEAHDILWAAHAVCPARGELVVFDRSYYERVINPLVHEDEPDRAFEERCEDIVAFERTLRRGGTVIVKILLHVGEEEQRRRLLERESSEETAWKVSGRDWTARSVWPRYMEAFERVVNATATVDEPWHVVPADDQALHNLAIAELLVDRLSPYRDAWVEARRRVGEEKLRAARAAREETGEQTA